MPSFLPCFCSLFSLFLREISCPKKREKGVLFPLFFFSFSCDFVFHFAYLLVVLRQRRASFFAMRFTVIKRNVNKCKSRSENEKKGGKITLKTEFLEKMRCFFKKFFENFQNPLAL